MMKTRFLIIIGIIIVLGSIATFVTAEIYLGQTEYKEKVGGLKDTTSLSNQECATLFDKIHEEFKSKPCACCNPPPGEPICEPVAIETILAYNKEFRDSGCESTYKNWVHLTNDVETASRMMYPSYFEILMEKTNLTKEIPITVEYRGYDNCQSFRVIIKLHEEDRPVISERYYENICSENQMPDYILPKYRMTLTEYGMPIMLPKGDYQLILNKVIDGTDEKIGQFYFSSHYEHDLPFCDPIPEQDFGKCIELN